MGIGKPTPGFWRTAKRLKKTVAYKHPSGAIIWVTLDRRVERKILDQLQRSKRAVRSRNAESFPIGVDRASRTPIGWEDETVVGIVVRKEGDRMKVTFAFDNSGTQFSWLTRHDERIPGRWIDNTYAALVHVEEASTAQREAFCRWVPPDRQALLIEGERKKAAEN